MSSAATTFDWPSTGPEDPLHKRANARALRRLRAFCLALPGTAEKISRGHMPIFTSAGKNFAIIARGQGRASAWIRAAPGAQKVLSEGDGTRYFVPAFVGGRGWVGAWLDVDVEWGTVEDLLRDGHRLAAEDAAAAKARRKH